ncbi:MAG: anaerobic ribonucleoside-triphosphate reductase activating protein [Erysipelotrichaceae bacterium]|nr:anaerobic ribonucleoside-triphosphate reductase activating protein [Erysipelotrichaceae bacterium]MBQ1323705.1 anaerobic ribonucleoside-triphosphate reductase activating protein [Erysipelotrichaceae bacterium]MBQ1378443.1 anaerobic ribonucleoside-triphosphate reductase activating protein [Erysipelotrichaceae bacterium]MBR6724493.1 anaerobic ribonucleoside-triphosphate reductase activating protein [Erysipelotrichaceae bacterium]MEE3408942.1 anaerobic ribonucleoside-triphosphate reductase acti
MSENNFLSLDSSVLYRCNQKHFDKLLDKYAIGYTHLILLTQIYESEGISMNELAMRGVYDKGTITKSIQRLEQLSYVRIENSEVDKRAKLLFTTDKTQEIMPDLYRIRSEWYSHLSSDISASELDTYNSVLKRLVEKARQYSAEPDEESIRFYGLQKLTLLDYPGNMAATVFTGGCNFRCPFCHNRSLVFLNENDSEIANEDIFDFLKSRNKILDGICITGGEPLLHKGITAFIKRVRDLGLKVKLDTNGSNFEALRRLIDEKLVDYVAMDIKNSPEKYAMTIGLENYDLSEIEKSKNYLLENHVDYEFRTTIVREFHEPEDLRKIGEWIRGAKHYYLQNFEDHGTCIQAGLGEVDLHTLETMKRIAGEYVEHIEIRGIKE